METNSYNIEQLTKALTDSYKNLREAIIDSNNHPNDEACDYNECLAGEAYDAALLAYNQALVLQRRVMEDTEELPF